MPVPPHQDCGSARPEDVIVLGAEGIGAAPGSLPPLIPVLDPVCGRGAIYTQPLPGIARYNLAVVFAGDPWAEDGRQPIAWHWSSFPVPMANPLLIAAARDVELEIAKSVPPGKGSFAVRPQTERTMAAVMARVPQVEIVRVESRDLVPAPGERFDLNQVLGEPSHHIAGLTVDWPPAVETAGEPATAETREDWLGPLADAYQLFRDLLRQYRADHVVIRPIVSGVSLAQANEDWAVQIRRVTGRTRGGYTYEIIPPSWGQPYGQVTVRVVHTADVEVSATKTKRIFTLRPQYPLTLQAHEVDPAELPSWGSRLSGSAYPWRTVDNELVPTPFAAAVIELTVVGASLIPVFGTVVDVAHLAYMYAYGRTFWQKKVTEQELFLEGAFVLAGVLVDVGAVARLRALYDTVFPAAARSILKPNPGLVPDLKWTVDAAFDPVLRHTLETVGPEGTDRVVRSLERHIGGEPLEVVVKALDEVVHQPYRAALDADLIPDAMHREAWARIHPAQIDGYDALDPQVQAELLDLTVSVAKSDPQSVRDAAALVERLTPAMRAEYGVLFDEWRLTRLFNVFGDGFTSRRLAELYAEYVRGKVHRNLPYANPVQWAASPSRRHGRAHEELRRLLGGSYKKIVRDARGEQYYHVSDEVAEAFTGVGGVARSYLEQTGRNPNGRVIEADHVSERRIYQVFESFLRTYRLSDELRMDDFQALLVPKNAAVAAQLRRRGIVFYYVHAYKTRLMQILVPHGTELTHTVQELFDAHVIVLRHQLGLPREMVQSLVLDEFHHLGELLKLTEVPGGYRVVDTSYLTQSALLARNPKFAARLATTPFPPAP